MAILSTLNPTMRDVTSRLDPDGKIADIAEVLGETNEIMDDMVVLEGNLPTGHKGTIRTGLPEGTFRAMYGYVQPNKSTTAQITDTCGNLEAFAEIDVDEAKLNGNEKSFRLSETTAFVQGISQQMASTVFYGDETVNPERFTGFAPRYSNKTAENGQNIVLTSASSPDNADNSSIWLVGWGRNRVHGIYPKGSMAGLQHEDLGIETKSNAQGGLMRVFRDHYKWELGLHVKDWRYIVRIQYNDEDLVKDAASGPDLIDLMTDAVDTLPDLGGRPAFYCNRRAKSYLSRQARNSTTNSTLSREDYEQRKRVLMFDGIPVRRSDALLRTESGVTV